ncbi:MAG: DUF2516 family protein [Actinomycetota bacterium]|nr:DUF2516 family protein [Actinomycetota bacterium]
MPVWLQIVLVLVAAIGGSFCFVDAWRHHSDEDFARVGRNRKAWMVICAVSVVIVFLGLTIISLAFLASYALFVRPRVQKGRALG